MSSTKKIYYKEHYARLQLTAGYGAIQCAYYVIDINDQGHWVCQASEGYKYALEGNLPEPSEGTNLCNPPLGSETRCFGFWTDI